MAIKVEHGCISCENPTKEEMDVMCEAANDWQDEIVKHIEKMATELGVDYGVAADIWYLRTRSRWTQDLENQIINAAKSGHPIDSIKICNGEWPEE